MDWQTIGVCTRNRRETENTIREIRESAKTRGSDSGDSGPRHSRSSTYRYENRSPRVRNKTKRNREITVSNCRSASLRLNPRGNPYSVLWKLSGASTKPRT